MAAPTLAGITSGSLAVLGVPRLVEVAGVAAELGYGSYWTAEANGTESFSLLGAVGAASPDSLALATGIVPVQVRSAPLAAMAAATLQALHPERDIWLGIGMSSPVITGRWHGVPYGERPLARIREYVEVLRACLSGERVDHRGDAYRIGGFRLGVRLGERRPKIALAALNDGMLRLAGEVADGVLLNYLPARHVAYCAERIAEGVARSGRTDGGPTVFAYAHACVGDRAEGDGPARRDLLNYAMADGYRRQFARAGYAEEMAELEARIAAGDKADATVAAISDRMVDEIDTIGDAAHVRSFVASYRTAGAVPVLMPLPWARDRWGATVATLEAAAGV